MGPRTACEVYPSRNPFAWKFQRTSFCLRPDRKALARWDSKLARCRRSWKFATSRLGRDKAGRKLRSDPIHLRCRPSSARPERTVRMAVLQLLDPEVVSGGWIYFAIGQELAIG